MVVFNETSATTHNNNVNDLLNNVSLRFATSDVETLQQTDTLPSLSAQGTDDFQEISLEELVCVQ